MCGGVYTQECCQPEMCLWKESRGASGGHGREPKSVCVCVLSLHCKKRQRVTHHLCVHIYHSAKVVVVYAEKLNR